jgi:hypothetical protein
MVALAGAAATAVMPLTWRACGPLFYAPHGENRGRS